MSWRHRLAAHGALWHKYRDTFRYFWQRRADLQAAPLRAEEAEFLPAALAIQHRPLSRTARLTAATLVLLVLTLLLWSIFGRIDIIVNAKGKLIPRAYTKAVSSIDVAVVRTLLVSEGQAVKAGQVLVELDATAPEADHDKAAGDMRMAQLQVARARALIAALERGGTPRLPPLEGIAEDQRRVAQQHLDDQYAAYHAKLERIDAQIARYRAELPLAQQRADDYKALLAQHDVGEHAWIEKQQAAIELQAQLADALTQRAVLRGDTRKEAQDALADGLRIAADNGQDARRSAAHARLLTLTAPVDGTVQQLAVHTVGGVVPAAQPLMLIVPANPLVEMEARLENRDVGFVREGQTAAVKIDTFDYTKYGTIPAHVSLISRDAIEDEKKGPLYAVKVSIDRAAIPVDGRLLPLSAGMSANVEIKTGERRIIEYLLSPLLQHQHETFRER
ncbi:HlyD family type I secretion periplasmic adaptor subunit [Duganella sp.]|uniref:HlyD family type I secretion periplasmic adaptor subunit n=1 Tax=Duganella sp. TaxID=1904440 RepID=UPI0031E2805B